MKWSTGMAIHGMFIYLCAKNAAEALDFYARAFGTREKSVCPRRGAASVTRWPDRRSWTGPPE